MYTVRISKHALKQLQSIPAAYQKNILSHIDLLERDPLPHGSKKLKGAERMYRIRVGMYRVLYEVYNKELVIDVITIAHRKDAYR